MVTPEKSIAARALLVGLSIIFLLAACSPAAQPPLPTQAPSQTQAPATAPVATITAAPPTASLTPTAIPATSTIPPTTVPPTVTPTLPKPTASRTPTRTPEPTFAFYNKTVKAPAAGARLLSFDEGMLWAAVPADGLSKIDTKTGKTAATQKFGCQVCFGPCDFYAAARDGQYFWSLQFGGIGPQNCSADNPWQSIGFMLRRIKIGSDATEYIDVSPILQNTGTPEISALAVYDGKIWLAQGETIYIIDPDKSKPDQAAVIKTIFPGVFVEGLLFANNTMWAAGDALLSIDPKTYQVSGVYPLEAQNLAFDGTRMWGANKYTYTLQSINLATRVLGDPIPLPDMPTALAFDGKSIWMAFGPTRDLAVFPAR